MNNKSTALVVGGNGITGRNLTQYLQSSGKWNVIVTSFSPLNFETTARFIQLNLLDEQAVIQQAEALKEVTHVFFGAYIERAGLLEQTSINSALLQNLVSGLERVAPLLQHIVFVQGGKAYGAHLGKYKTPALETDIRHFPPNFYYSQEDFLRKQAEGKSWSWTAIRPDIVMGITPGNPMNLANVIAVYASLCKELQVPFRFPGTEQAYNALVNVTDAGVLAQAMEWAAITETTKGEVFNITNGDVFRWSQVWPALARFFGLNDGPPITFSLQEFMADKEPVWADMVKRYGLQPYTLANLVKWPFGDFIFNGQHDAFFDVNKARRYGFTGMPGDSLALMLRNFQEFKDLQLIP
jgi:nucleoside-diphosphate-sugar epimerase